MTIQGRHLTDALPLASVKWRGYRWFRSGGWSPYGQRNKLK